MSYIILLHSGPRRVAVVVFDVAEGILNMDSFKRQQPTTFASSGLVAVCQHLRDGNMLKEVREFLTAIQTLPPINKPLEVSAAKGKEQSVSPKQSAQKDEEKGLKTSVPYFSGTMKELGIANIHVILLTNKLSINSLIRVLQLAALVECSFYTKKGNF